jgi:hypothetical protein
LFLADNREAELPVVLFSALDLDGTVELFEKHHPSQGVREGDRAEGPEFPAASQYFGEESQCAADRDGEVALTGDAEVIEFLRESFRRELLSPLPVEGDEVRVGGQALEDTVSFPGEYFFAGAPVDVFFCDFDDVYRKVAAQPSGVVFGSFGSPAPGLSDADDGAATNHRSRSEETSLFIGEEESEKCKR